MAADMLSNRICMIFDLSWFSMTINSACSSSLVALDMACQGLKHGKFFIVQDITFRHVLEGPMTVDELLLITWLCEDD